MGNGSGMLKKKTNLKELCDVWGCLTKFARCKRSNIGNVSRNNARKGTSLKQLYDVWGCLTKFESSWYESKDISYSKDGEE